MPTSVDRSGGPKHSRTPQLAEVLSGRSVEPWSLASFSEWCQKNFCDELLLFTNDVKAYRQSFDSKIVEGATPEDILETYTIWREILGTYIMPNGHKEINIPGAVRNKLLSYQDPLKPPSPVVLQQAYDMTMELMTSTYYQFVEHVKASKPCMLSDKVSCFFSVHSYSDDEGSVSSTESNDPLPFYRRAHALWGPSRVYRNVRWYHGDVSKTSVPNTSAPSVESADTAETPTKSKTSLRRPHLRWTSSGSSSSLN